MQVTLGIPTQWGLWRSEMALSLIRALHHLDQVHLSPQYGPYLDENREASAQEAVAMKSDHLAFVDTDMIFPPDAIANLIDLGKDVVGANYYEKRFPLVSTVKLLAEDGEINDDGKLVTHAMPTQPFRCAGVGAGLMVVNVKRMVDCIAPPYFAFADLRGKRMGEELSFCKRARDAGMEVWCDPRPNVYHIGDYPFGKMPSD